MVTQNILVGHKYFAFGMLAAMAYFAMGGLLGMRKLMKHIHSWKKRNSRSSMGERTEQNVICMIIYIGSLAPLYEVCHTQSW